MVKKQICSSAVLDSRSFLVLFLTLSGCSLGQQTPCLAKNPLMPMLKANMVEVFNFPTNSGASGICKFEWNVHQSCCEPSSVITYAEADMKQLDDSINQLKAKIIKLVTMFHMQGDHVFKSLKKRLGSDAAETFKKDLKFFEDGFSQYIQPGSGVNSKRRKCFDYIKYIRTRSLCSVCSGRSSHFFLQGRALISMPVCNAAVGFCGDVWKHSVQLLKLTLRVKAVIQHFKEVMQSPDNLDFANEHTEILENWISSPQIQIPIENCSSSMSSCTEQDAKLLCEAFLTLRKDPIAIRYGAFSAHQSAASLSSAGTAAYNPNNGASWRVGHNRLLIPTGYKFLEAGDVGIGSPSGSMDIPTETPQPQTDIKNLLSAF